MISGISLLNFRNWQNKKITFDKYNVISGKNATGKTNILEAVYYCAKLESWRSSNDTDLVMWEKPYFEIKLELNLGEKQKIRVFVDFSSGSTHKKVFINEIARAKKTISNIYKVILFSPDQIELVSSPQGRRKYLNNFLSQKDIHYDIALKQLNKVLRAKNHILEKIRLNQAKPEELYFWNLKLVESSQVITDIRREWFSFANQRITDVYQLISQTKQKINYEFLLKNPPERLMNKIEENIDKEILAGVSLYGPHRDDWGINIDYKNLLKNGSRGEWRSVLISQKVIEAEFLCKENFKPIIILDDFLSELDDYRKKNFFAEIKDYQVILTCAQNADVKDLSNKWKIIKTDG